MVQIKSMKSQRFICFLLVLISNPIPFIFARSIQTFPSSDHAQIRFEGLLGCNYDLNICNEYEFCFDGKYQSE